MFAPKKAPSSLSASTAYQEPADNLVTSFRAMSADLRVLLGEEYSLTKGLLEHSAVTNGFLTDLSTMLKEFDEQIDVLNKQSEPNAEKEIETIGLNIIKRIVRFIGEQPESKIEEKVKPFFFFGLFIIGRHHQLLTDFVKDTELLSIATQSSNETKPKQTVGDYLFSPALNAVNKKNIDLLIAKGVNPKKTSIHFSQVPAEQVIEIETQIFNKELTLSTIGNTREEEITQYNALESEINSLKQQLKSLQKKYKDSGRHVSIYERTKERLALAEHRKETLEKLLSQKSSSPEKIKKTQDFLAAMQSDSALEKLKKSLLEKKEARCNRMVGYLSVLEPTKFDLEELKEIVELFKNAPDFISEERIEQGELGDIQELAQMANERQKYDEILKHIRDFQPENLRKVLFYRFPATGKCLLDLLPPEYINKVLQLVFKSWGTKFVEGLATDILSKYVLKKENNSFDTLFNTLVSDEVPDPSASLVEKDSRNNDQLVSFLLRSAMKYTQDQDLIAKIIEHLVDTCSKEQILESADEFTVENESHTEMFGYLLYLVGKKDNTCDLLDEILFEKQNKIQESTKHRAATRDKISKIIDSTHEYNLTTKSLFAYSIEKRKTSNVKCLLMFGVNATTPPKGYSSDAPWITVIKNIDSQQDADFAKAFLSKLRDMLKAKERENGLHKQHPAIPEAQVKQAITILEQKEKTSNLSLQALKGIIESESFVKSPQDALRSEGGNKRFPRLFSETENGPAAESDSQSDREEPEVRLGTRG